MTILPFKQPPDLEVTNTEIEDKTCAHPVLWITITGRHLRTDPLEVGIDLIPGEDFGPLSIPTLAEE